MKTICIMCGAGIATSTIAKIKVEAWVEENGCASEVKIQQSKISDELGRLDAYDAVICTTTVPEEVRDQVISGVPLLTGIGTEEVFDALRERLGL